MKELSDIEFKRLGKANTTDLDLEELETKDNLVTAYRNIVEILKKYCDMKEDYYSLIAVWIVGTYFHDQFISYPYLFFNAMRGSGKSRILRIISVLAKDGQMLNSLTEAVLFRTGGSLCIDEFEGLGRKGNENLRELLNSAYKKGTKVKRMRKVKKPDGEDQEVQEFDVYRPICIANIFGMETVLGDRCINLILEKSQKLEIIKLMEIFEYEEKTTLTKMLLSKGRCSLCGVYPVRNIYTEWNSLITQNNTLHTNYYTYTNNTNNIFLKKLMELDISGRDLELAMPLLIIGNSLGEDVLEDLIKTIQGLIKEKKQEDVVENTDVSLFDFISQQPEASCFISVNELTNQFKEFLQTNDDWVNARWMGRALKRLSLIKEKRRISRGVEVILNYQKAKKQILMFK